MRSDGSAPASSEVASNSVRTARNNLCRAVPQHRRAARAAHRLPPEPMSQTASSDWPNDAARGVIPSTGLLLERDNIATAGRVWKAVFSARRDQDASRAGLSRLRKGPV